MKSFKQYITESETHTPYPWNRQQHSGWWHPSGRHFTWPWDIDGGEFHVTKIVQSPHLFGFNHDDIHNIITSNDPSNKHWKEHFGWKDEDLKKKLADGTIDVYPPIETAAHDKEWVGVRRTGNLALMGRGHALRYALGASSLHIPPAKLDTEKINLFDTGNNKRFDLVGFDQIHRYMKYGSIPDNKNIRGI